MPSVTVPTILIVEDCPINRRFLGKLMHCIGYQFREAENGAEALALLRGQRADLVISDVLMPAMDGFEFVRRLRSETELARTPVIFFSANYDRSAIDALAKECGAVFLLEKPAKPGAIMRAVKEALYRLPAGCPPPAPGADFQESHMALLTTTLTQKVKHLENLNQELARAYDATLEGWVRALDLRDRETEGHTQRVTTLAMKLASALAVPGEQHIHIRRGALLHDIGKLAVSDAILLKPGPLDARERRIMEQHPEHALRLLEPIEYLRPALDIPFCHHEKWDGSGYPRGLRGESIPAAARLFAVVDVWDALSFDRPYRRAWDQNRVLDYLRAQAGKHFDPQMVGAFLAMPEVVNATKGACK
jgi:putative two-component system response regulator